MTQLFGDLPENLSGSIEMETPVFTHDGVKYWMIGADKRHDDVSSIDATFSAETHDGVATIQSNIHDIEGLGGLVVSHLAVKLDKPVTGIKVTESLDGQTSSVVVEGEHGGFQLPFGGDEVMYGGTFDDYIAMVFKATAKKLFVPRDPVSEPDNFPYEKVATALQLTPEGIRKIEAQSLARVAFYLYNPETKKVKKITNLKSDNSQ